MGISGKLDGLIGLGRKLRAAQAQGGKSPLTQLREIARLYRKVEQFGLDDYFDYRLYAADWQGPQEHVAGWRMLHWLDDRLNPREWRNLAADKLCMYELLAAGGLTVPRMLAVYERNGRGFQDARRFQSQAELGEYLRRGMPYPFFCKPVHGDVGSGAFGVAGYEAQGDALRLVNGEIVPLSRFLAELERPRAYVRTGSGYLFQELIRQHPRLCAVSGERISGVRLILLMTEAGPQPFSATWKIITGNNMTDNHGQGRGANLNAAVDLDSGRVLRAISGSGLATREVAQHPDSGALLPGFELPDWPEAVALCCRGARVFPMLRWQHWDIALSADGPLLLELNVTGGFGPDQNAARRGFFDARLRGVLASK